jgi:hypothetical protein
MGIEIDRERFEPEEYQRFSERLRDSLAALRELLARPGFGLGERTLGAELEVSIIDDAGQALSLDRSRLPRVLDEHITLELNRFNLEYNLSPLSAKGKPFSALAAQLDRALAALGETVRRDNGTVIPIGILPTLRPSDLESHVMTDSCRYRALSTALRSLRDEDFEIRIRGEDSLSHRSDDVTLEGAGTSFQLHLRTDPAEFASIYNASQLATLPALAISANSPVFLEHRLWDETRVALFKQAIDSRPPGEGRWRRPARVSFGHGWVTQGAWELFAEAVSLFPPLLPVLGGDDPLEQLAANEVPELAELRLHQGTVWRWNRAIYDPADGGHLRVELRALPSGPGSVDMAANAAYALGLTLGLATEIDSLIPAMPFEYAHHSFYRVAQKGLDAEVLWPSLAAPSPAVRPAAELVEELLPVAERGLDRVGVDADEAQRHLGVIRARLEARTTPARWQRRMLERLERGSGRREALAGLVERYMHGVRSGQPLHEWSDEP